jgi:hypothetical protein
MTIEVIRQLMREHGLSATSISRVNVYVHNVRHEHSHRQHAVACLRCQRVLEYDLALLLLGRDSPFERYDLVNDPLVMGALRRVEVAFIDSTGPAHARIEIISKSGRVISCIADQA